MLGELLVREFEYEVGGKALLISTHLLVESAGVHAPSQLAEK
jgi:hypothetical protein